MANKERGGLSKREFAAQKKVAPAVKPAAKVSSKDRGGLSGREFAAATSGGKLDYKTGKITKPAPVTKKVTYNMGQGQATVRPVYGPSVPASFSKLSAVQNYTPANKNFSSATGGSSRQIQAPKQNPTFTQNVKTGVKSAIGNIFTKIKNVAGVGDDTKVKVKDVARELPGATKKVASGIGKFSTDVARGIFVQAPTTALLSFKQGLTGKNEEYVPQTKIEKAIAGNKPIISVQKRQERGTKMAKDAGLSGGKGILAGAGLAIGSVVADALPGPGKIGGKGLSTTARKLLDAALKSGKSQKEIEAIVKADANGAFSSIGKGATNAGKAISDVTTTPKAKAADFTPADKTFHSMDDAVVPRGTDEVIPNVSTKSTSKQIERTDVEAAKETAKASQSRIQKALDDYKNAPKDELGNISDDVVKTLDDTLKSERENLSKVYKDITGEDLPDDVEADEVLARLDKFGADNERNFQLQDGARRSSKESFDARQTGKPTKKEMRDLNRGKAGRRPGILTLARRKKLVSKNDEAYGGANKSGTGTNESGTGINESGTGVNISGTADETYPKRFSPKDVTPNAPKVTTKKGGAFRKAVGEMATKAQEVVQDNWIRVKRLQESPDAKIDKSKLTPYEAETLFHGRVGHRLETANETLKNIDKELADAEKLLKNPDLRKSIDQYLIAKHAPERNAIHGEKAAGMTDAEAAEIVKAFEGDEANKPAMEIARKIKETNHQTLEILHDAQVIDDEAYKTLRETYKEHVPLYRILDEDEDIVGALSSKGYDVRSSGLKKAKGSEKEVDDILTNVAANLEQAIVRAEKNRVNLATLNFARENKQLGLFEEIKPKAIGTTFAKEGEEGKPILEQVTDPLVLTVRENGKPVYLRIKDPNLAVAFKGIGNEKLPPVLNFISGFTRLYSSLATRFNPEFVLSNKLRDLQEMAVYMSSQKDIGFSGAGKAALRDSVSMKDVVDGMRGADTPGAKLYKQMQEDGGTTGGQALSTKAQLKIDIEDMRKLNRGGILNMRKRGKQLVAAFDSWNQVFEDSTRLSVYKTALDKGLSREQAAIMAKNSTINFNKKGTGGAVLNGLYMFSNASIQGSTKLIRAMRNPKTALAVSTAVGGSVWAVNSWNDKVDPSWRDKVSKWDRDANMVVVLPSDGGGVKYLTIPVSWGLKPMKVMADMAYDASNGHLSEMGILKGTGKVLSSFWDAYNPTGGTDLTSSAVPSFLDIPVEIARNKKWSGSQMRPEDKEGVPASENFFQNKEGIPSDKSKTFGLLRKGTAAIAEKTGGAVQINPANLKYALDGYLSGFGRSITGAIETGAAVSKGTVPPASDTPFARRFYKEKTAEEVTKTGKYDARDELYAKLNSVSKDEQGPIIQEYLNKLPADQRKGAAYGLSQEGFKTKGTTTSDDVIRMKSTVEKVTKLEEEGKYDEVDALIEGMSEDDQKAFKNAMKSMKAKATADMKEKLTPKVQPIADQIVELEKAGKYDESDALFYGLSEDEQKVVQSLVKNK